VSVLVLHPRGHFSYEAAVAAQEAGLLHRYVTAVYRTGRTPVPGLWHLLPRGMRDHVDRELSRRWHPALDPDLVTTRPAPHLLYQFARRVLPLPRRARVELEWASIRAFGRGSACLVRGAPRPALVHAYEGGALEVLRAARRAGVGTVLDVPSRHEDFVRVVEEEAGRWGLPAPALPAGVQRRVDRERAGADVLLVPSQETREALMGAGVPPDRIVVLPFGADPDVFHPRAGGASGGFRAVYVGHVNLRKGVRYLLEAWSRLALPGGELLLVGNADAAGRALLAGRPDSCRLVPNVPHRELPGLLASADAFVFPSLAEGSPIAVYEAMAAGLPVVTTDGARAAVRHGVDGIVVPARNVEALADAVAFLHRNVEARLRMGREARRRIEEGFTWRHYRVRLVSIYRHLLEGGGTPVPLRWNLP